ncbi:cytochrome P450 [Sphingomonas sp. UV9]|uniref:cytochrome P450 n=1 Tax=Sphingomonas sp. UV9 TaxID=1851410 RepID=UPI0013E8CF67|nr:cytochrome P450 [Sphingomonas sp. UV9]
MTRPQHAGSTGPIEPDVFGLLQSSIFHAPHETYHLLRYADPIHWHDPTKSWLLTGYKEVHALLNRPDLLSSAARRPAARARLDTALRDALQPIDAYLCAWSLDLDPPAHTAVRHALNQWFTPALVRRHAAGIETLATSLAETFAAGGGGDLIGDFAHPFPVRIIAEIVGVPREDHALLLDWFARLSAFFERGTASTDAIGNAAEAIAQFDDWAKRLLDLRVRQPREDIVSALAAQKVAGLDARGVRSTLLLLLFSGHESSRAMIGNALLALALEPREAQRLREAPELMKPAVEEFLRYDGPFMRQDRVAAADFELRGRNIRRGDRVVLVLGAANRDPARFHAPDRLVLDRRDNHHVAFGHGIHSCLGSRLARLEIATAVHAVLRAMPTFRLGSDGYRWREHFNNRGLARLHLVHS